MEQTLALYAIMATFWASVAFIVVYTIVAKWWHTRIGWARISLDFAMVMVLGPAILAYYFPQLNGAPITWCEIGGFFVAAAVILWNTELVVRTQIKKWRNK